MCYVSAWIKICRVREHFDQHLMPWNSGREQDKTMQEPWYLQTICQSIYQWSIKLPRKRTFCITWVLIVPAIKHPKQHWSLNGTTIITYLKVRYIKIQTEIVCYLLSIGPVAGNMLHSRKQQNIRGKSGLDCQLGEYLSPNNHLLAGINIPHWYFWNCRRPHKNTYLTTKNRRANEQKKTICSPTFFGETCVSLIDDG